MPLVPRRGLLAIAAVVDVALHADNRLLSAKALSVRYQLAPRHLEPLLQALVHVRILRGVRGPRGGYAIGRPLGDISLHQILRAVSPQNDEGDEGVLTDPVFRDVVLPAIEHADRAMREALEMVTIADLVLRARASVHR